MEFWGTEVGPGKPQLNVPGEDTYCHVSQAALGPSKDGKDKAERVVIRVETGGKNVVLGTLVAGKVDQMALDLIFDRDFTLSHTSTSASVFFCGYKTEKEGDEYTSDESSEEEGVKDEDDDDDEDDEDYEVPKALAIKENGIVPDGDKLLARIAKKTGKTDGAVEVKAKKADAPLVNLLDTEALEDSSDENDSDDDEDDDEDMAGVSSIGVESDDEDDSDEDDDEDDSDEDDDDEDDSDDDEDEEEGLPAEVGKKRVFISSKEKSPVAGKKARVDTPAKPGLVSSVAKKAGGAADAKVTPKSAKKTAAEGLKTQLKTPAKDATAKTPKTPASGESAKSIGAHHCAECSRNFASDSALSQHSVAKHKK